MARAERADCGVDGRDAQVAIEATQGEARMESHQRFFQEGLLFRVSVTVLIGVLCLILVVYLPKG